MSTGSPNRFQEVDNKRLHAQFYTCECIGDFLVSNLPSMAPKNILDLCMGEGALLESAAKAFSKSRLIGCDIDEDNVFGKQKYHKIQAYHVDSTAYELLKVIPYSEFDLVLGNPPFHSSEQTEYIKSILNKFGIAFASKQIPSALLFLVIGILLTKDNGVISYIVPDGLLTNNRFKKFREILFEEYRVLSIVQLGTKQFEKTEAHTHIITIRKKKLKGEYKASIGCYENTSPPININKKQFTNRADFSFYRKALSIRALSLGALNAQLLRGRKTHKQLKSGIVPYIHTTSFSGSFTEFSNVRESNCILDARKGDILVARVGTRVIGKIGFVKAGTFPISDCIIIVRVKMEHQQLVLNSLNSDFGRSWLESVSKGVGARHITIADLKGFPIYYGTATT